MEVSGPSPADRRPGTPCLLESSDTPTNPPRLPLSLAAPRRDERSPLRRNPPPRSQLDWKLATTSLAEAHDSAVFSLQGRPQELANALAARFVKQQHQARQAKKLDTRDFLRLPGSSNLRDIGPHGIRVSLSDKDPGDIEWVQSIPTVVIDEGKAFLLSPEARELEADGHFDDAMECHQVLVPRIPRQIWPPDGRWSPTTIDAISAETERADADSLTAIIAFPQRPRHELQLFWRLRPISTNSTETAAAPLHPLPRFSRRSSMLVKREMRVLRVDLKRNTPVAHNASTVTKGAIARLSNDALTVIRKTGRTAYQQQQATLRLTNLTSQAGSLGSSQARSPLDLNYEDLSS
ncbi:uncharacterized protein N7473_008966 [Penicillium subrubescens]|uniref:uncharacterized protein n=1 Tax=Penicillium subrubescens TaxID=1316194 RepID=UPI002544D5D4|nr:uncharacterized protein N7473_008966 [Penicillium subrubescens]KAJ5886292.1 hypothetical protein N7473_008966 [Penicillium subrubescens]